MNIPDKAVETAMKAGADFGYIGYQDANSIEGDGTFNVREALEAAAPFIAAQALRDYADSATATYELGSSNDEADFARSDLVNDLRDRADTLDPQ